MKQAIALAIGCCLASPLLADAEHQVYFSAEYISSSLDIDAAGNKTDSSPQAFGLRVGQQYSEYFAIEALAAFAISDDEAPGFSDEFEMEDLFQFSIIGLYPHLKYVMPYLQLGVAYVSYEDKNGNNGDGTDLTYAIGAKIPVNKRWGAKFEYQTLPEAEYDEFDVNVEGETINIGIYYQFSLD